MKATSVTCDVYSLTCQWKSGDTEFATQWLQCKITQFTSFRIESGQSRQLEKDRGSQCTLNSTITQHIIDNQPCANIFSYNKFNILNMSVILIKDLGITFFFRDVNCPFASRNIFFTGRFLGGDDSRLTFKQLHLFLLVILFYGISFWTHKRSNLIEKKVVSEKFQHLFLFDI